MPLPTVKDGKFHQPQFYEKFELPVRIPRKQRRKILMQYAAQLRAYGAEYEEIKEKVFKANEECCDPPLVTPRELKDIDRACMWAAEKATTDRRQELSKDDEILLRSAENYAHDYYRQKPSTKRKRQKPGTKRKRRYKISMRSVRIVALALCQLMRDEGRTIDVAADSRTLAEKTGLSRRTVSTALSYLSGAKTYPLVHPLFSRICDQRIRCTEENDERVFIRHAYTYTLKRCNGNPHILLHIGIYDTWATNAPFVSSSHLHDAFAGLKSAPAVYDYLPVKTQEEAKEKTGLCLKTVKNAFKFLQDYGLVEKKEGSWVKTTKSLDAVAIKRETVDAGAKKKEKHQQERREYREGDVREEALGFKRVKMVSKENDRAELRDGCEPFPSDEDFQGFSETRVMIDEGEEENVNTEEKTAYPLKDLCDSEPLPSPKDDEIIFPLTVPQIDALFVGMVADVFGGSIVKPEVRI